MGRTIHYLVPKRQPVTVSEFRAVQRLQAVYNHCFTWTCEQLDFERPGYVGNAAISGFTKVRDDEWNAFLVVQFLRAASRLLPGRKVRVGDEGDFILVPAMVFLNGEPCVDVRAVYERRRFLVGAQWQEETDRMEAAVKAARNQGRFFATVPAKDYRDRKEFDAIREQVDWERATLDEVAALIPFPDETLAKSRRAA